MAPTLIETEVDLQGATCDRRRSWLRRCDSSRRSTLIHHLEPPVRPVPGSSLERPRDEKRDPFAGRPALVTVEFESIRFMQVSGASVIARPIRRPGRSNVTGVIDGDSDDRVGVGPRSRKGEGVVAVRRPDGSSRSRRGEWRDGEFREIADKLRPRHLRPSGGPDRDHAELPSTSISSVDVEPIPCVDPCQPGQHSLACQRKPSPSVANDWCPSQSIHLPPGARQIEPRTWSRVGPGPSPAGAVAGWIAASSQRRAAGGRSATVAPVRPPAPSCAFTGCSPLSRPASCPNGPTSRHRRWLRSPPRRQSRSRSTRRG